MKKGSVVMGGFFNTHPDCKCNRMFEKGNKLSAFGLLKSAFKERGYDLSTSDINHPKDSDFVIYIDVPIKLPKGKESNKSYLWLSESELIKPNNQNLDFHKNFRKVFTWNDSLVDNMKYFKLNYSYTFPKTINKNLSVKEKLCVFISANKKSNHSLELYSERLEAVRWFEKNHLEDFDMYGRGWDRYRFSSFGGWKITRVLDRIPYLPQFFAKLTNQDYPSYRGIVKDKKKVMKRYKFSICYENVRDIPGYISEKIFDSFFSGCVPIYWGANNILDHIPKNCLIDKREFDDYNSLYEFINNMDDDTYLEYLENIDLFLNSDKSRQYSIKYFTDTVIANILE
jgi:alpha(1,3/1,4) fucosyltransferase